MRNLTYITLEHTAAREIGDFQRVRYAIGIGNIGPDSAFAVCLWIHGAIVGEQWGAFEASRLLEPSRYHVGRTGTGRRKRALNLAHCKSKSIKHFFF